MAAAGFKPDEVTYGTLLTKNLHFGRIKQAENFLFSMLSAAKAPLHVKTATMALKSAGFSLSVLSRLNG
jgi:hypothetical protein